MGQELRHTPLEEEHRRLGAKLAAFAGWLMPIEYEGTIKEHTAVREAVGLFDLTHLGKVEVAGPGALASLQRSVTGDIATLEAGEARYTLVCTAEGGVVDDVIVYRQGPQAYLAVPNAANTQRVLAILERDAAKAEVRHRPDLVTIAVQGPRALELVEPLFPGAADLAFMSCAAGSYRDAPVFVCRSGYTGEPGVELFPPQAVASELWRDLMDRGSDLGVRACGLGARDTLRLEMGYPLHGNDLDEEHTPLEAGLSWAVAFDKGDFTGREALLRQREEGVTRRLRGVRMTGRLIPRPHYAVSVDGREVGETTSGSFSPTLRVGIGMAYLDPDMEPGAMVEIDIRGKRGTAEVVKPPFVDRSPRG